MQETSARACLGIGDPCIDVIADAQDDIINRFCQEQGGSTLVDADKQASIMRALEEASPKDKKPHIVEAAGGSAANVMVCIARLACDTISCQYVAPQ